MFSRQHTLNHAEWSHLLRSSREYSVADNESHGRENHDNIQYSKKRIYAIHPGSDETQAMTRTADGNYQN